MNENELKEQFEATEYDDKGNIKLPPPPLMPPKQKRPTVASVKKDVSDLESYIENDVLAWCGQLDVRIEKLEERSVKHNETLLSDVEMRIEAIEAATGALADAVRKYGEGIALWNARMEECEDLISELQRTWTTSQETLPGQELEFAQPPEQTAGGQAREGDIGSLKQTYPPQQMAGGQINTSDIAAVAGVCLNMTDVLMICRALKESPKLTDQERNDILNIACKSSGVIIVPGLQIRAGMNSPERETMADGIVSVTIQHGTDTHMRLESISEVSGTQVPTVARVLMDQLYLRLDDQVSAAKLRAHRRDLRAKSRAKAGRRAGTTQEEEASKCE